MFQVVVEVCGGAAMAVLLMVDSFFIPSISCLSTSIYMMIANTEKDSYFYGRAPKKSSGPSCLANHDESLAIDYPLPSPDHDGRGTGRVRLPGSRSTAP